MVPDVCGLLYAAVPVPHAPQRGLTPDSGVPNAAVSRHNPDCDLSEHMPANC